MCVCPVLLADIIPFVSAGAIASELCDEHKFEPPAADAAADAGLVPAPGPLCVPLALPEGTRILPAPLPCPPLPLPHSALHAARCSPPPPLLRSPRYSFPLCMHVLSMYCTNITLRCVRLLHCFDATGRDPPTWTLRHTRTRTRAFADEFHVSSLLESLIFRLLSSRFPRRVASRRIA